MIMIMIRFDYFLSSEVLGLFYRLIGTGLRNKNNKKLI